jgi:HSP20 family protein
VEELIMNIKEMMPTGWFKGEFFGPDSHFCSIYKDMNRFSHDFTHAMRSFAPAHPGWWSQYTGVTPYADVFEDENAVEIRVELPGMDEKDIDIRMTNNMLTIKGEKKTEKEFEGKNCFRRERTFGSFYRSIAIPFDIERDKMEACFKNGVLSIKLTKNPIAKEGGTKISIKSE